MLYLIVAVVISQAPPVGWEIDRIEPTKKAAYQGVPQPKAVVPSRFVIVNPNPSLVVRTTYLLDTATGRCWILVKDENGSISWQEVPHIDA